MSEWARSSWRRGGRPSKAPRPTAIHRRCDPQHPQHAPACLDQAVRDGIVRHIPTNDIRLPKRAQSKKRGGRCGRAPMLGHKLARARAGAPDKSVRCLRCGKSKVVDSQSTFNLPGTG